MSLNNSSDNSILSLETETNSLLKSSSSSEDEIQRKPKSKENNIDTLNTDTNTIVANSSIPIKQPEINWRQEALIGNFMPAVIKLDRKELNVNELVELLTQSRLIHLAVSFSYLNVTRCLIELFDCDVNMKNGLGQTALHIICNNKKYQDVYLFSYFIKNDVADVNCSDKSGMTPLFYAVINKFNLAILALVFRKSYLTHVENMGNNVFYFALTTDNKFAVKLFMRHMYGLDVNQTYYQKQASLADILIATKNSSCVKHLVKYWHSEIKLNSIVSCKKNVDEFLLYNKFNYDLLNTLYYYKTSDYNGFFKAILRKKNAEQHCYDYALYNLWFFFYHLMLMNTGKLLKLISLWIYAMVISYLFYATFSYVNTNSNSNASSSNYSDLISFQTLLSAWQLSSIFTLIFTMIKFSLGKYRSDHYAEMQYNMTNPEYARDNVCAVIYEAMDRNPLDVFFEEEICEVCLIKKDKNTNHCHVCDKCVKEFYFHSKLLNMCFNRNNIHYYILFLSSLAALHLSIVMMIYYIVDIENINLVNNANADANANANANVKTIYTSNSTITNCVLFLINASIYKIITCFILIVTGVLFFQKTMTLIICYGYKTTYYNMFRMHKRSVGIIQPRMSNYYNIPQMNLISISQFLKNLICRK